MPLEGFQLKGDMTRLTCVLKDHSGVEVRGHRDVNKDRQTIERPLHSLRRQWGLEKWSDTE